VHLDIDMHGASHPVDVPPGHAGRQQLVQVNLAGRAINSDLLPGGDAPGGVSDANHRGNAVLARDDGAVRVCSTPRLDVAAGEFAGQRERGEYSTLDEKSTS
jgi:hypothetical protein